MANISETLYVFDRTEYVDPANPTGPHVYRVQISTVAPGGTQMPGTMVRVLQGISATDAAAYTPGVALTTTYVPES